MSGARTNYMTYQSKNILSKYQPHYQAGIRIMGTKSTTAQKIDIVREEAEREANVDGPSDISAQHKRTVERINNEVKK